MKPLDRTELEDKLRLDYRVVMRMTNPIMSVKAFRNADDMRANLHAVTAETDSHHARHYRVEYRIKTLSGQGQYMALTLVHIDLLCGGNYPYSEPSCWVLSRPMPWSPHFKEGYPICIGGFWKEAKGKVLLGHLLIHIARLLNFDEVARESGYQGWNGAAIDYWKRVLKARPITPQLSYPVLPAEITHAVTSPPQPSSLFHPVTSAALPERQSVFQAIAHS